jgi:hypothetical protein
MFFSKFDGIEFSSFSGSPADRKIPNTTTTKKFQIVPIWLLLGHPNRELPLSQASTISSKLEYSRSFVETNILFFENPETVVSLFISAASLFFQYFLAIKIC